MNLLFPARAVSACDQVGQFSRPTDGVASLASLDDPPGNATRASLLTVLKDNARDLLFRESRQQIGCRLFIAPSIHAHVERRILPEAEPPAGIVELKRRDAQINQHAAHGALAR